MAMDKRWYAVYTRPRWEKKVAESLVRKNIETFCPLNKELHQWADRKKIVYEPLFSCYVFVFASDAEHLGIRQTDGILNFVYWLGAPAIIRNEEIDIIKDFLNKYENMRLEKIDVSIKDKVRIVSGPLIHKEGVVLEKKRNSIKVSLPSLGYALIAEVELEAVEMIKLPKQSYVEKNVYQ